MGGAGKCFVGGVNSPNQILLVQKNQPKKKKKKKKKISKETVSDTLAQFLFLIKMIDDGNDLNLSEFDHSLVLVVFLLVQVSAPTCFS